MGFNSGFKGLNTIFIFPRNTSIFNINSTYKVTCFGPYRAIIRPYYKNRFIHFQYILGSQIVQRVGTMLQFCVLLFTLRLKLILKQKFVCLRIMLAKNSYLPIIIILIYIRLLLNCHTLIACQFLLMPTSLQRLFVLVCRVFTPHGIYSSRYLLLTVFTPHGIYSSRYLLLTVFTPHGFVVFCLVFGWQQYDVSWPGLSNCVLIILSLVLFCIIADYGPCLFLFSLR